MEATAATHGVYKRQNTRRLTADSLYLCAGITLTALGLVFFHKNAGEMEREFKPGALRMVLTAGLFLWCVLSLGSVSSFVYFQF